MTDPVANNDVVTLALLHFPDGWRLMTADRSWGRFDYLVDAEDAALREGARLAQGGRTVKMLRQGRTGELRTWIIE